MRRLLFLISSSPSVFSIVYLNRVNRDFAIFRELGFSEFQEEFHAGLVELTVQITHQRIDQSAARALSHILPTPIDALVLTPMVFVPLSVRWKACGQSAFTMGHVFFASATGVPTDRTCIQVSNPSECVRAPSRILSTLMHLHLDYILCHSCGMFNRQRMYSPYGAYHRRLAALRSCGSAPPNRIADELSDSITHLSQ